VVVDDDSYVCAYHGKTVTDSTSRSAMDAGPQRAVELLDKSARLELARLTELESVCVPLPSGPTKTRQTAAKIFGPCGPLLCR
jgi:hypothetical protein